MSILDTLTPRTVTVTGARLVKLGLSETPHGRYPKGMSSNTLRLLNNYRAGLPVNGNALRTLREKGLI